MQVFKKEEMRKIIDFFTANIYRYFYDIDFEFCLAYIKSPDVEYRKMIASILRKTDCVFELDSGIIILFSGASKENSQMISNEIYEFLNTRAKDCVAYFPYDGDTFEDLMLRLNNLTTKNYKVNILDESK